MFLRNSRSLYQRCHRLYGTLLSARLQGGGVPRLHKTILPKAEDLKLIYKKFFLCYSRYSELWLTYIAVITVGGTIKVQY